MASVLVLLLNDTPDQKLLETANQHISGTDMSAVVCRLIDESQYQSELPQNARSGNELSSIDELEADATETAEAVVASTFDDDSAVTAHGIVGHIPDAILEFAAEHECEHIFVTGRKRSPVGKALFGDVAQHVLLEFDGPVTVTTVDE
ncbi:universal stress protein [Natronolimnobius sp. AArcel1]|uniref:universal stress protein n=1 Tax=Natronolimnobius sp. AArcel1 TaxID=1679093 RepID=UPI0013EB3529|nr:universal stress protein [Natronolimnobius sp. AArcel1]NGM67958.1 universal stress protein [Natronolimnobius sp. AArcel1]